MSTQPKPQTAIELGLMQGFPPAPDKIVTHENQLYGPYNRWSFQNELPLNHVVDVWRGRGAAAPFVYDLQDLSQVTYHNRAGAQFSFDDMVEMSHTDGILVLHRGKIIYERYLNGLQPHSLHAWASCSKSMTGVLAAQAMHEGLFDADAAITTYLPELRGSGFEGASVRQVFDMTTGVGFATSGSDSVTENDAYGMALGWLDKPASYSGPADAYAFLPTMVQTGPHGHHFTYQTPNSDVLAWLLMRLLNQSLAEMMHARIWAKLGAERDAFWIVGPAAFETSGSGLLTTLPDMARFGQMLLQKGQFNGQQILPAAVVEDIAGGADTGAFARGPAAGPTNQGWSYHYQWWVTHDDHGAYLSLGYGGQMLYIDPAAHMVIAKFSSYPTPTPAGNEFYSAFAAFPVLGRFLMQ